MFNSIIQSLVVLLLLASCSGVKFLSDNDDLYRASFISEINIAKEMYSNGQKDKALIKLQTMQDDDLLPTERSLRRNLVGVIFFTDGKYEQAVYNFDIALATSRLDSALTSEIYFNLASSYYKLGSLEKAYATLLSINDNELAEKDKKKYYMLRVNLAKDLGKENEELKSLVYLLSDTNTISALKTNKYFEQLATVYFKLSDSERVRFIDEFESGNLTTAYLGYLNVEKLFADGNKTAARDLLEWVESQAKSNEELSLLVKNFFFRMSNFSKIDSRAIGVVLPLSGPKKRFGERALVGIDSAFQSLNSTLKAKGETPYKLYIEDSGGSGAAGAYKINDMIEKYHVSAIVGGLFATEANKQYIAAKRKGAFFVSLSEIYIPKENKDHLLLEIPGSIESQIDQLFSEDMLSKFGKRAAIIYPRDTRGNAYLDEFWRKAKELNVDVTDVVSYDINQTDFRDQVKNVLGLKFPRERHEEDQLWADVYSQEGKQSIKRVQTLKPQIDFDWIFVPAYPKEALQILPAFGYYDAFHLNMIGDPSWRSGRLAKEGQRIGRLYFVGDDIKNSDKTFADKFYETYKIPAKLVEMRAFDAIKVIDQLLADDDYSTRDELDAALHSQKELEGLTGSWKYQNGLWLKKLASLELKRGKLANIITGEEGEDMSEKADAN